MTQILALGSGTNKAPLQGLNSGSWQKPYLSSAALPVQTLQTLENPTPIPVVEILDLSEELLGYVVSLLVTNDSPSRSFYLVHFVQDISLRFSEISLLF